MTDDAEGFLLLWRINPLFFCALAPAHLLELGMIDVIRATDATAFTGFGR